MSGSLTYQESNKAAVRDLSREMQNLAVTPTSKPSAVIQATQGSSSLGWPLLTPEQTNGNTLTEKLLPGATSGGSSHGSAQYYGKLPQVTRGPDRAVPEPVPASTAGPEYLLSLYQKPAPTQGAAPARPSSSRPVSTNGGVFSFSEKPLTTSGVITYAKPAATNGPQFCQVQNSAIREMNTTNGGVLPNGHIVLPISGRVLQTPEEINGFHADYTNGCGVCTYCKAKN